MTAFSIPDLRVLFLATACLAGLVTAPACARSDLGDRTAGPVPHSEPRGAKPSRPSPERQNDGDKEEGEKKPAKSAEPSSPKVLKVDYTEIESLGVLSSVRDGSLGRDIWANSERSQIIPLLESVPVRIQSPTMERMFVRALLSRTDAEMIENDVRPEPGRDLLTVRIKRLLDLGAYQEAASLYSAYDREPYHEQLARTGALALLSAGNPSLACVEAKTVQERFSSVAFWQQMQKFCTWFLSKEGGKQTSALFPESQILSAVTQNDRYRLAYNEPGRLRKYSQFEQAVLSAEGRISPVSLDSMELSDVPADSLGLLAFAPDLSSPDKLNLAGELVRRGIAGSERLAEAYESIPLKSGGSLPAYDSLQPWQRLPYLYQAAISEQKNKVSGDPWPHLRAALQLESGKNLYKLLPFAEMVRSDEPEPGEASAVALNAAYVIMMDGRPLSDYWSNALNNLIKSGTDAQAHKAALLLFANEAASDGRHLHQRLMELLPRVDGNTQQILWVIASTLDIQKDSYNNPPEVYEKLSGLTFGKDYVMPSVSLKNRLQDARENGKIGQVILLSAAAFYAAPPESVYPGLLYDVLQSLISVGLDTEARKLSVETVLGLTTK